MSSGSRARPPEIPLDGYPDYSDEEMNARAAAYSAYQTCRRTVRDFDTRDVPVDVIAHVLRVAGSAPSGANFQPWHFVVVRDAETKSKIREAAEAEERRFYEQRAPDAWLEALRPLGTDEKKPFLEAAPVLIAIFAERYAVHEDGSRRKNYYVDESVGIATGMLIAALHHVGLATLTHTPSPMGFLREILGRPSHEKPYLLLVVGHPAEHARVPDISRKTLGEIASYV